MKFPVLYHWAGWAIPAHTVFESAGYFLGFQLFRWQRAHSGDHLPLASRLLVITAAIAGAALGSKLLFWLEDPVLTWQHRADGAFLLSGKTIVGGLLGGLITVEWAKRRLGITRATGDLFALPLALGIAIGRIGCFLGGLPDQTYGLPTSLPWGVDFGDGVPRHPTQLYECAALLVLLMALRFLKPALPREGDLIKLFMTAYLLLRLALDSLKPGVAFAGLTTLQWACVAALLYYAPLIRLIWGRKEAAAHG